MLHMPVAEHHYFDAVRPHDDDPGLIRDRSRAQFGKL
jgi:hypothetical protein